MYINPGLINIDIIIILLLSDIIIWSWQGWEEKLIIFYFCFSLFYLILPSSTLNDIYNWQIPYIYDGLQLEDIISKFLSSNADHNIISIHAGKNHVLLIWHFKLEECWPCSSKLLESSSCMHGSLFTVPAIWGYLALNLTPEQLSWERGWCLVPCSFVDLKHQRTPVKALSTFSGHFWVV